MNLHEALLFFITANFNPGNSAFSVEPCENGRYSSFYQTTVCKESRETAIARYDRKVAASIKVASELLCLDVDNRRIRDCKPYINKKNAPRWTIGRLVVLAHAVSALESGYREDVDNGRGYARPCKGTKTSECGPDDVGGRGRGPARETCGMQIHPDSVGRFGEYSSEDLLGTSSEAYERCFSVGMKMLLHARAYCDWHLRTQVPKDVLRFDGDWLYHTVSLYGSGNTCFASGASLRVAMFEKMYASVRRNLK